MDKIGPRLLICGDRNWSNKELIRRYIKTFKPSVVIEGEAPGADSFAREIAEELGIEVLKFPALWEEHGKAAGPIRNAQMLKEGQPTVVIGFHDNLKASKGTKHMLNIASKAGLKTIHVTLKGDSVLNEGA